MDSSNNFAKTGQAIANKAADRVQAGIHDAQHAAKEAGSNLSAKVDEFAARAQSMGTKGIGAASDAASQASDTIIEYTRENPVKALMIAVASGALLPTLIKILNPTRD